MIYIRSEMCSSAVSSLDLETWQINGRRGLEVEARIRHLYIIFTHSLSLNLLVFKYSTPTFQCAWVRFRLS